MENHYQTLGLKNSATTEEIRRAYRVLARRYHPDVNPGKTSEDRFKKIASAYSVLSDPHKKSAYDIELERNLRQSAQGGFRVYQREFERFEARKRHHEAQRRGPMPSGSRKTSESREPKRTEGNKSFFDHFDPGASSFVKRSVESLSGIFSKKNGAAKRTTKKEAKREVGPRKVSVIEVSVSVRDAVFGVKRTVEISEPEGSRKISVSIPPGQRNGSVIHLMGKGSSEELVLIVRVATHPFLSIQTRGLVAEIPITVNEAISGSSITVPSLEDPVVIKVPPGTQSGTEMRVSEKGLFLKDGTRGDLFVRLMIQVPTHPDAVGLREKGAEIDQYYNSPVRQNLPKSLIER